MHFRIGLEKSQVPGKEKEDNRSERDERTV